jgi:hypothetical protein
MSLLAPLLLNNFAQKDNSSNASNRKIPDFAINKLTAWFRYATTA